MDPQTLTRALGAGRAGVGLALLAAPDRLTVPWLGRDAARPPTRVAARGLGARDLALGAGAVAAAGSGRAAALWVLGGVIADATDLAATVSAGPGVPLRGRALVGAMAGGGLALGLAALPGLRRPRNPA